MGTKEEEEAKRKAETFSVTTKSGREYTLPVDQSGIGQGIEKFKTGYDQPEVDEARKRALAARARR